MKKLIIAFLAILLINICIKAQTKSSEKVLDFNTKDSEIINKYLTFKQKEICPDQVFVHTDRNLYNAGDTIHFQAYIRNGLTGVFDKGSAAMYALLFNNQNEMIDSSRFKIVGSSSSGWMAIPKEAKMGRYRFVAFTSSMQNYDPKDAFKLDLMVNSKFREPATATVEFNKTSYSAGDTIEAKIKITGSKKNPIKNEKFNSKLKLGKQSVNLDENRTNNEGISIIKFTVPDTISNLPELQIVMKNNSSKVPIIQNFEIPYDERYIDFRLLPEGGTLAEGIEQKIGFNATNLKGEPVYIEGLLLGPGDWFIDSIKSGPYGPGSIITIPEKDMYVKLINVRDKNKIYPLPEFNKSGLSLSVNHIDKRSFSIDVQSNYYKRDTIIIVGTMNTNEIFTDVVILNNKKRFIKKTDNLPTGVIQITLFDASLMPLAKRLLYVNSDKKIKFNIKSDTSSYIPGQEIELAISVTDGLAKNDSGIFSVSVVNALSGHDNEIFMPGIEYIYNYHPYFIANLPPKVLEKGLENLTDQQRDLLFMVYGWSKISWNFNKVDSTKNELFNYEVLNIKLINTLKKRLDNRLINLISLEGLKSKHLITDGKGQVSLPLDSLEENVKTIIVTPDEENDKKIMGVILSIPFDKDYSKNCIEADPFPNMHKEENKLQNDLLQFSGSDTTTAIPEVLIKGNFNKKFNDEFQEGFQTFNIRNNAYEDLWLCSDMISAISKITQIYFVDNDKIVIDALLKISTLPKQMGDSIRSKGETPSNALIVLDGNPLPLDYGWSMVNYMRPKDLKSLTILKGLDGFYRYGINALGGVIFVNSRPWNDQEFDKRYFDWSMRNNHDMMYSHINIYRYNVEFYNPNKAEIDAYPELQDRPCIYWNPIVYFNGKDPVKIKYLNNYKQGPIMVTINGVSTNNLVGSSKFSYRVQKSVK